MANPAIKRLRFTLSSFETDAVAEARGNVSHGEGILPYDRLWINPYSSTADRLLSVSELHPDRQPDIRLRQSPPIFGYPPRLPEPHPDSSL